jgi:hypothetical protein
MPSRTERFLILLFIVAGALHAQQTTATFQAVVTDSSGAVIPEAMLAFAHQDTGSVLTRTTNETGEAIFDFLRVGNYTLRVEARGFKRLESKGIELTAAQKYARHSLWKSAPRLRP